MVFSSEYFHGFRASRQDVRSGDIYCIESAIVAFHYDPPENEFQRGYLAGLVAMTKGPR